MSKFRRALVEGRLIDLVINKMNHLAAQLSRRLLYRFGKVQNNKVFIMTFEFQYTCNPRYIAEELLRRKLPVDIVWVIPNKAGVKTEGFPPEIRLVKRHTMEMYEEMATAKVWIDNALNCVWDGMPKKKSQVYFNTWHGSMGIKRLSGDPDWLKKAARCRRVTDYCISNSVFEEDVFRETFWPDSEYLRYGHARNDILFKTEEFPAIREKVAAYFGLTPGQKVLLYAPTFRDDLSTDCYGVDYIRLKQALERRFGGEWVILVRAHFKNRGKSKVDVPYGDHVKNASAYPDMQELLAVADAGITDYSSWAYDYVLTGRPMFLFATDVEQYDNDRGFYYPLSTTPFAVCRTNRELEQAVLTFEEEAYAAKCAAFLKDKGCAETGHAAERIVDKLQEIMGL